MRARQTDCALLLNLTCFTEEAALISHRVAAQTIVSKVRESLFISF